MAMVKKVALAAAVVAAYSAALAGAAGAAHHNSSTVGCTISVSTYSDPVSGTAGTITVNGTGLAPGHQVSMWYSVPNMAGFLNIDTVAADGTIHDVSYTNYSGSWMGATWTYTAQIWSSSTGDIGKGSPLATCSTSVSL